MSTAEELRHDAGIHSGSTDVILARMEGKIDRLGDRMERYERDISGVRSRIHDLSNDITPIVMLDLPGRIRTADSQRADTNARLNALEAIENQRKGAAKLAGALWAVAGATGVGGVVALLRMFGI